MVECGVKAGHAPGLVTVSAVEGACRVHCEKRERCRRPPGVWVRPKPGFDSAMTGALHASRHTKARRHTIGKVYGDKWAYFVIISV